MSLRQIIRKEVQAVFDAMPNEQQLRRMQKEVKKIVSKFSKYRFGTSEKDPNFKVWYESFEADLWFDQVLINLDVAKSWAEEGNYSASSHFTKEAEKDYQKALGYYNKAKRLYRNANRK